MDDFMYRLDRAVESGELNEEEAREEMREYEAYLQMQMEFDQNGDPYMDFLGNPW